MSGRERRIPINFSKDKPDAEFSFYLCVVGGVEENDFFKIPKETFIIGSSFGCDFHLSDKSVPSFAIESSPVFSSGKLVKIKISVAKGTVFLGNKRVKKGELFPGDVLRIGKTVLQLEKVYPFEISYRNLVASKLKCGLVLPKEKILGFFKQLFSISSEYGRPMSIILLSVDYFKILKQSFGEQEVCLIERELYRIFKETVRKSDFLGKIEENLYFIVLPETHESGALNLAKRIREKARLAVIKNGGKEKKFTVSQGVVSLDCYNYKKADDFFADGLRLLDKAMAKGRDNIEYCFELNA